MDAYDGSAGPLVEAVMDLPGEDPTVAAVQAVLEPWRDGGSQMAPDSPGAAVHAAVWRHLLAATFDDELPEEYRAGGGSRWFAVVEHLLDRPDDAWWDDVRTGERERGPDTLSAAVRAAHRELVEVLGDDPAEWRWGDLHVASFENQTLGQSGIGPIEWLLNRTAPSSVGGGPGIVNATGWHAPDGYQVVALPSMRMVVDLGDPDGSLAINTTGQSGHAYHQHYVDMVERWSNGGSHPMRFGPEQVGEPEGVLRLVPEG
jgi:penicillin G amidase